MGKYVDRNFIKKLSIQYHWNKRGHRSVSIVNIILI